MARYIDADALLNAIAENCQPEYQGDSWYGKEPMYFVDEVIGCIKYAPTADVRENVKGEWEVNFDIITGWVVIHCSACGEELKNITSFSKAIGEGKDGAEWKFCPNCGADMRGGENG